MITTVLLDLDGVIRHFDPDHVGAVEARHELAAGVLQAAAFAPEVIEPVVTGVETRQQWMEQIGKIVNSPAAATEWLAARGTVDAQMLQRIDRLRSAGVGVSVLTNGTDTVAAEMDEFGVTAHVDQIFNSAEIGFAKPDIRAFEHVTAALCVDPAMVFFTDDTPTKLTGAQELGMEARHFTGVAGFDTDLADLGLA